MRKEMDELKGAMKEKKTNNLEGMVQRTDSSFTTKILECPLPPKFHLPQFNSYNGLKDPLDHVTTFKMTQILPYIKDKQLPSYLDKAKKIKMRATRFTILNDVLHLNALFEVRRTSLMKSSKISTKISQEPGL